MYGISRFLLSGWQKEKKHLLDILENKYTLNIENFCFSTLLEERLRKLASVDDYLPKCSSMYSLRCHNA